MRSLTGLVILIKGAGEAASAIAHRLHVSHFKVCMTELRNPLAVCRATTYSEAIFDTEKTIEGVTAELVRADLESVNKIWAKNRIPIVVDPGLILKDIIKPDVLIDATLAKKSTNLKMTDAPLVIGLGPGFYAGKNVHMIVETHQGNSLGRVLLEGEPDADTREPLSLGGLTHERVLWAQAEGVFISEYQIGDQVEKDQVIARLDGEPLHAPLKGILRGLVRSGVKVPAGAKIIEVDHINNREVCYIIRDKFRSIAGGVLEAIMMKFNIG